MRIAYFGYNALSSCLDLLAHRGHEITSIYTGEASLHSDNIINSAQHLQCQLSFDKPSKQHMEALVESGVDMFFAAEYPWRIPIPKQLKYAINVHPTLLPEGRGPTPLPSLILHQPQHAGVSLHKMTDDIDGGDILLQQKITIDKDESFDTLSAKLFLETPLLLDQLLTGLSNYYEDSTPQIGGSYWPQITRQEQTVDWNQPTPVVLQQIRAFGSLGTYTEINGHRYLITHAEGVKHQHNVNTGDVLSVDNIKLVIATSDGLVSIARSCLISLKS
ncbi:MAG: methionyl-tRNA formyltransferase [Moraxellaceae bacterium]|nr:MAG: methionyl-tRNA formyltransferase [Moraxellaceae bacterium]